MTTPRQIRAEWARVFASPPAKMERAGEGLVLVLGAGELVGRTFHAARLHQVLGRMPAGKGVTIAGAEDITRELAKSGAVAE